MGGHYQAFAYEIYKGNVNYTKSFLRIFQKLMPSDGMVYRENLFAMLIFTIHFKAIEVGEVVTLKMITKMELNT